MLNTAMGFGGMVSAPHAAAAQAGRDALAAGGTAVEAMVAAAATIAVVYPHMNAVGGDAFWIVKRRGAAPVAISGAGRAAALASPEWYAAQGVTDAIPTRGPLAALTVPGAIPSWAAALTAAPGAKPLPVADLLRAAVGHARGGFPVTGGQSALTADKRAELEPVPGFADAYMPGGAAPARGARMRLQKLGDTLAALADAGLDSFHRGDIAAEHGRWLESIGSPLRTADFERYRAETTTPLTVATRWGRLYNMIPPTQGVASLMILGLFDRLGVAQGEGFDHLHGLIEATKQAFIRRNAALADPDAMAEPAQAWLAGDRLDALAGRIDRARALPWPHVAKKGDTIWMGAADRDGTVVSFIQSVFWEFGSGCTCPATGVTFQNRGAAFSLAPGPNRLAPGKRPFHTLNPALAELSDGRVMAYGNMGGEGQPQTQAAVFTRHVAFGMGLQQAITAPRWLLGKTWGDATTTLKLEDRFDPSLVAALKAAGHEVEMIAPFSDLAGHAGAVVLHPDGLIEGASDPRADGIAAAL
jgi:gamma-glutamyltranspeptidase/glutathione hydrolase